MGVFVGPSFVDLMGQLYHQTVQTQDFDSNFKPGLIKALWQHPDEKIHQFVVQLSQIISPEFNAATFAAWELERSKYSYERRVVYCLVSCFDEDLEKWHQVYEFAKKVFGESEFVRSIAVLGSELEFHGSVDFHIHLSRLQATLEVMPLDRIQFFSVQIYKAEPGFGPALYANWQYECFLESYPKHVVKMMEKNGCISTALTAKPVIFDVWKIAHEVFGSEDLKDRRIRQLSEEVAALKKRLGES